MKDYVKIFLPKEYKLIYRLLVIPQNFTGKNFKSFFYKINKIIYKSKNELIIQDVYNQAIEYNHSHFFTLNTCIKDSFDTNNKTLISILKEINIIIHDNIKIRATELIFIGGYEFDIINANVNFAS